jgi:hypothetical protein
VVRDASQSLRSITAVEAAFGEKTSAIVVVIEAAAAAGGGVLPIGPVSDALTGHQVAEATGFGDLQIAATISQGAAARHDDGIDHRS